jgi:hypothetical protein
MNFRHRTEHRVLRMVGSTTGLVIIALAIGLAVAASLAAIVWVIASALHHAANS